MSYAPQKIKDMAAYGEKHGIPCVGIVGDQNHTYGYHLGDDRLGSKDYSVTHPRDKEGLTNAASAIDFGNHKGLKDLTNYLASLEHRDIREVIGPGYDGRAYRWSAENDWNREGPRERGDSHEWHCHVSFYRDSEYRDKVGILKGYVEDMALSDSDIQKIVKAVVPAVWKIAAINDVIDAPQVDVNGNPATSDDKNTPGTYLKRINEEQRKGKREIIDILERLSTGTGYTLEEIAKAVADEQYRRQAE